MQDLDNNMDELLRKAGEGYPLKADADGWDKISPMLLGTPVLSHIPNKKNNLKKYSILIILLLVFFLFGTLTSRYVWKKDTGVTGKLITPILPAKVTATKSQQTILTESQKPVAEINASTKRQVINKGARISTIFTVPDPNEILSTKATVNAEEENNTAEPVTTQQSKQSQNIIDLNIEKQDWQDVDVLQKSNDTLMNNLTVPLLKADVDKIPATTNDTPINKKTKNVKTNQPPNRFYIGALAGVALNRVKNQGLQKPGFDVGLKAGYQFTKQFSIETGLLFEQKLYYTSGEYFNISKIASAMPVGMKVLSLKGKFSVFELPLTFKYNLPGNRKDRHFYTTAGISTYLMSKEYNQYQTLLNGTQNNMTGTYRNQSTYSAALLNISIGYERNIGSSFLLRVDPYIQFPIKGLGVGAIPVTTVGVHLGVFRFTHQ